MKLLIAVKSCQPHRDADWHEPILNTWGKNLPENVDLRFFVGAPPVGNRYESKNEYEVCLGCPDEYIELPRKTKAIVGWSLWNQYDFSFLCDTDTFLDIDKLLRSDFRNYDYSGRFGAEPKIGTTFHYQDERGDYPACHPWASGGIGYFLSRKAAGIIALSQPNLWAEDMWVGQVLGPFIQGGTITAADLPIECNASWHFPQRTYKAKYDPKFGWMEKMQNDRTS